MPIQYKIEITTLYNDRLGLGILLWAIIVEPTIQYSGECSHTLTASFQSYPETTSIHGTYTIYQAYKLNG